MLTIRTMKQIATSRTIASSRTASLFGKKQVVESDRHRIAAGHAQMQTQKAHRQWLIAMYRNRAVMPTIALDDRN
jgi:hypothetical protein